ncbi:DUF6263 family protein [Urbifossiella limnaea]|uniref:DUF4412 domain-containing protein n=1 Tax=Urbifossiella limnaea TaxID=2528023 RepID=A0A517XS76_9BACT|nr:DUF6263 family protein [Urbifossiella limnaea]QDU20357.1 hypothetical protein ETAA1_23090 [Urbifossiella limnaea]
MRPVLALALTAGLVVTSGTAQEPVTVKWTLKEGQQFYAKAVTDMDMSMGILGMNVDLKMKTTAVQKFKVSSVKDDSTTVEMTFLDMSMEAQGLPGGGGLPGLGDIGDKIKGAKIGAVLDKEMQVTKLIGYEKFIDKIAGDDDTARAQLGAQLSEAAVGQMVSQAFTSVPPMPVKAGDTWSRTTKVPAAGLGDATVKEKYTFDGVSNGVAKIGVVGDMTFKSGKGGVPGLPPGVKVSRFSMKAEQYKGTQLFDLKAGRLKEGTVDMVMKGSLAMSANGQDIEMTMRIKAKQSTTVTEKNPVVD